MQLYNTLSRRKESLRPVREGRVHMYSCGPTVYRYIHIGNLRTFTMADWLRRVLVHAGLDVLHVKNITDVGHMRQEREDSGEDKLVAQARKEGRRSADIAAFYTQSFMRDEARLNILPAHVLPRATDHVADMIAMIQGLQARGIAYAIGPNVYYDVKQFASYGQLSGNQFEGMRTGVRENPGDIRHNEEDFPLWKEAEDGREMAWDSPWGRGFPGWHIECSAMATRYLGEHVDIHTGGVDNIFPHHENELAQSEGLLAHRWVSLWVHAQHLLTDGLKMAKSTGNDYTLDEIVARGFEPLALRYLFATTHYRSRLNFTFTALSGAQTALDRLRRAACHIAAGAHGQPNREAMVPWQAAFTAAIEDDIHMPRAMAVVWNLVRRPNGTVGAAEQHALLEEWDAVLGLDLFTPAPVEQSLPEVVGSWLDQRMVARTRGDFVASDQARREMNTRGFGVRDQPSGSIAYRQPLGKRVRLLTTSNGAPDRRERDDRVQWSINLIARNNRDDLQRCIDSIVQHAAGQAMEVVVIDNGSTDGTLEYVEELARLGGAEAPDGTGVHFEVLFADHNLGFAGGRNATIKASTGRFVVLMDTSIEVRGDIWTPLARTLADPDVGVAGPFGLTTTDLREFEESTDHDVDAIEGYLFAMRRDLVNQVGLIDEKFRFYRLTDIYWSFFFKAAGFRVVVVPEVVELLVKHPHREWYSLLPEEQRTKSKKNYDLFRDRWHHGESLLSKNMANSARWRGHDDPRHLAGTHTHEQHELSLPGQAHIHPHRHLADHEHTHAHTHTSVDEVDDQARHEHGVAF